MVIYMVAPFLLVGFLADLNTLANAEIPNKVFLQFSLK